MTADGCNKFACYKRGGLFKGALKCSEDFTELFSQTRGALKEVE